MLRMVAKAWRWLFPAHRLTREAMAQVPDYATHVGTSPILKVAWDHFEAQHARLPAAAADELWQLRSMNGHPETMSRAVIGGGVASRRVLFIFKVPESLTLHELQTAAVAEWWARWHRHLKGPYRGGLDRGGWTC